jgi:hypothetical protein
MIIDDFVSESFKLTLESLINAKDFDWQFSKNSAYSYWNYGNTVPHDGVFQFCHMIKNIDGYYSKDYEIFKPLIYFFEFKTGLKIKGLYKLKVNMLTQRDITEEDNRLAIHKDMLDRDDYVSFVYYVNDSDGDTIVYDEDKINIIDRCTPKANRCFWFKSNQWHNATPPKNHQTRIIINCTLQIDVNQVSEFTKLESEIERRFQEGTSKPNESQFDGK